MSRSKGAAIVNPTPFGGAAQPRRKAAERQRVALGAGHRTLRVCELVDLARARGSRDDISVLIVELREYASSPEGKGN